MPTLPRVHGFLVLQVPCPTCYSGVQVVHSSLSWGPHLGFCANTVIDNSGIRPLSPGPSGTLSH